MFETDKLFLITVWPNAKDLLLIEGVTFGSDFVGSIVSFGVIMEEEDVFFTGDYKIIKILN